MPRCSNGSAGRPRRSRRRSHRTTSRSRGSSTRLLQLCLELREALADGPLTEPLGPHDERVLVVVRVVAATHARAPEPVLLVELLRRKIRRAHLERQPLGVQRRGHLEDAHEEPLADPLTAAIGVNSERRNVRLVDHEPESGVADDAAALARDEVARVLVLRELVAERVRRPRDRERRALDFLHAVDVVEGHVLDDDRKCGDHPFEATASQRSWVQQRSDEAKRRLTIYASQRSWVQQRSDEAKRRLTIYASRRSWVQQDGHAERSDV